MRCSIWLNFGENFFFWIFVRWQQSIIAIITLLETEKSTTRKEHKKIVWWSFNLRIAIWNGTKNGSQCNHQSNNVNKISVYHLPQPLNTNLVKLAINWQRINFHFASSRNEFPLNSSIRSSHFVFSSDSHSNFKLSVSISIKNQNYSKINVSFVQSVLHMSKLNTIWLPIAANFKM